MSYDFLDHYDEVATYADSAAFLLAESADARSDLTLVADLLDVTTPDEERLALVARSARVATDGVLLWLKATAAGCRLAGAGADVAKDDLFARLTALSWAWGRLPDFRSAELQDADKRLLSRVGVLSGL